MKNKIHILLISGSLRTDSSNQKIIDQLASVAPPDVEFNIYHDLGKLPHFNGEEGHELVNEWRNQIQAADGVLICTPEYAFGIPGSLKNALDWTVSSGDLYEKPLALITASGIGEKAHAAMLHVLTAITAKMNDDTKLLIQFIRSKFNEKGDLNAETFAAVQNVLKSLVQLIKSSKENEA